MSHLLFKEESDILSKMQSCENDVHSTIFHHRKKLNVFTPQLTKVLHTALEQELSFSANARSSHWRGSGEKDVLKNFAKLTGKHLCQGLFFNKVEGLRQLFLQKNSGRLLLKCGRCKNEAREIDYLCCICPTFSYTCQPYLPSR